MVEAIEKGFWIVVGGFLSAAFGILAKHYLEWRAFQQEMFLIQDRFDRLKRNELSNIPRVYAESIDDVAKAVHRVRPYLPSGQQRRLLRALQVYREAGESRESGLIPSMKGIPENTDGWFEDYEKARQTLNRILQELATWHEY